MRTASFLLVMLLSFSAFAERYSYNEVITCQSGNDNFSFASTRHKREKGSVMMNGSHLKINGKDYELKASETPNVYEAKNYKVEFIYKEHELSVIKMHKLAQTRYYVIDNNSQIITKS